MRLDYEITLGSPFPFRSFKVTLAGETFEVRRMVRCLSLFSGRFRCSRRLCVNFPPWQSIRGLRYEDVKDTRWNRQRNLSRLLSSGAWRVKPLILSVELMVFRNFSQ